MLLVVLMDTTVMIYVLYNGVPYVGKGFMYTV